MFLPTAHIGDSTRSFQGKECLTWNEVRELRKYGISFGSHTVSHPQLCGLNAKAVREEVVVSKDTIEQGLGCAVQSFAYPFAFPQLDTGFKARLRETLREAGYRNGVCTNIGRSCSSSDPFFLQRLPINSGDDRRLFHAKLVGAYDWVSKPQYLVKAVKSWARTQRVG
jgi:peptidoglycan/xylan/chitin deacetylase (PgdA/CDA1 family)